MKGVLFIAAMLCGTVLVAQTPVEWKYSAKKVGDKLYEVRLTAEIDPSWHIYSQQTPDGGPLPTSITFSKNPLVQLQGKAKEVGNIEKHYEEAFGVDVYAYAGKVEFVQLVKVKSNKAKTNIQGNIEYMACTNEECLPPATVPFTVSLE